MLGCVQVKGKHCTTLYKGIQHPQIWVAKDAKDNHAYTHLASQVGKLRPGMFKCLALRPAREPEPGGPKCPLPSLFPHPNAHPACRPLSACPASPPGSATSPKQ